jgi:hypothetical protein
MVDSNADEPVIRRIEAGEISTSVVELSTLQVLDCEVPILDDETASIQAELRVRMPEVILRVVAFAGTVAELILSSSIR